LVDLFEYMMVHGLTNPKFIQLMFAMSFRETSEIDIMYTGRNF